MRLMNWTERQYEEENSPAIIYRILWLEDLDKDLEEFEAKAREQDAKLNDIQGKGISR